MVVWIASYPRSGNTLLRMLIRYGFGMSTFSVFDELTCSPISGPV